jgi:hypothetical protein
MSTKRKSIIQGAVDAPQVPAQQTPTVTFYQQVAERFMKSFDESVQIIPKLEGSHVSTATFVRSHLNVPVAFLATTISSVEQHETLQVVQKLDPITARDTLQYIEAFRPVLDKATAFERNLAFTLNSLKALLVADALQIYDVAKGLARDPASADMAAHVANMKRDLGRRGRPRLKKPPAPAPETHPTSGTVAEPRGNAARN